MENDKPHNVHNVQLPLWDAKAMSELKFIVDNFEALRSERNGQDVIVHDDDVCPDPDCLCGLRVHFLLE